MAEIVSRRSWGGVLPLGRQASISGSSLIQCASVSIALSSFQEGQNARHHKQFKREQALVPLPSDYDGLASDHFLRDQVVAPPSKPSKPLCRGTRRHVTPSSLWTCKEYPAFS